jgi:CheY-like chemotaxis protein
MPQHASTPLLVISAAADPHAGERALEAGADAFFAKPFSPALLRNKLQELMDAANHASSSDDAGAGTTGSVA